MNRVEFMTALANAVLPLPQSERAAVLEYYRDYFDEALEDGKTEAQIIGELDTPAQIAARLRAEFSFRTAQASPTAKNTGRVISALIGIVTLPVTVPLALGALLVGLFLCAVFICICVAAVAIELGMVGLCVGLTIQITAVLLGGGGSWPLLLGLGLIALGLTILCGMLLYACVRGIFRVIAKIARWTYRKITGKGRKGAVV